MSAMLLTLRLNHVRLVKPESGETSVMLLTLRFQSFQPLVKPESGETSAMLLNLRLQCCQVGQARKRRDVRDVVGAKTQPCQVGQARKRRDVRDVVGLKTQSFQPGQARKRRDVRDVVDEKIQPCQVSCKLKSGQIANALLGCVKDSSTSPFHPR